MLVLSEIITLRQPRHPTHDPPEAHGSRRGPELKKKTPIFFVDAKRSQIAQEFQKHKS